MNQEIDIQSIRLHRIKQSMIDCLKDVKFDVIIDEIKVIQHKLFEALILSDDLKSFHSPKNEEISEKLAIRPRVSGVVQAFRKKVLWEKVFSNREQYTISEKKDPNSLHMSKQGIIDSLRSIEFDITNSDCKSVDDKLASAIHFLHLWITLCPDKAELCTFEEWNRKIINELSLNALSKSLEESGRIRGLVDKID